MQEKNQSTIKRQKRNTGDVPIITDLYTMDRVLNKNDYCYPKSIQKFTKEQNNQYKKQVFHPTQKPVALMVYLINTYTNENETVLDFTMGSGSTGVACKQTNRYFIGIEQDEKYFKIAQDRINSTLF